MALTFSFLNCHILQATCNTIQFSAQFQQAFFTADILTCRSQKSAGVIKTHWTLFHFSVQLIHISEPSCTCFITEMTSSFINIHNDLRQSTASELLEWQQTTVQELHAVRQTCQSPSQRGQILYGLGSKATSLLTSWWQHHSGASRGCVNHVVTSYDPHQLTSVMATMDEKRKVDVEGRCFQERWKLQYFSTETKRAVFA